MESALKFLQEALAHLDQGIEQARKDLQATEQKLEELARDLDRYAKERAVVAEAIQKFLGKP